MTIARVFRGRSTYGLVRYLLGEGRRNEHENPRVIASWDGLTSENAEAVGGPSGSGAVAELASLLDQPVRACDRVPEDFVYHLVLRNAPEDRELTDDEWQAMCVAAMDRVGIAPEDDPAGCRWIAVRHADEHVHIVATLAREDGRPPRIWGDFGRLAKLRHEFEERFGLRSTAGRDDQTAEPRPGVKEQVAAQAKGRPEPPRLTLRRHVHTAAATSNDWGEFVRRLADADVEVWPRYSTQNPDEMTGYSVSLVGWNNAAGQPVRFGGGKLAPDLSLPKLEARWEPITGWTGDALDPADSSAGEGIVSPTEADAVLRDAERIVRRAADELARASLSDPDKAADAAWAASDALTATASVLEPNGGPMTKAAEIFQRAGRDRGRRRPAPTDAGAALRRVGRTVAAVASTSSGSKMWTSALMLSLLSLVTAVEDYRRSQGRLHQAEMARTSKAALIVARPLVPPSGPASLARASYARAYGPPDLPATQSTRSQSRHSSAFADGHVRRPDSLGRARA